MIKQKKILFKSIVSKNIILLSKNIVLFLGDSYVGIASLIDSYKIIYPDLKISDNILNLTYDDNLIKVFLSEEKNHKLVIKKEYDGIILFYEKNKKETSNKCINFIKEYKNSKCLYTYTYIYGYEVDKKKIIILIL